MRTFAAVAVLALALAACTDDPVYTQLPCNTDATCGGYACVVAPGATSGFCTITCANGCADGYACGTGTDALACVSGGTGDPTPDVGVDTDTGADADVGPEATCADLDCGTYACDPAEVACYTDCTEANFGTHCAIDAQCDVSGDVGACVEVSANPYHFVAVVSRAEGDAALGNQNPGPDLDAISVTSTGRLRIPAEVSSYAMGEQGGAGNSRAPETHADAVMVQDVVVDGVCDLDVEPGYVSIGGIGGFIVVTFDEELATGDRINVYEIDSNYCTDAATERPDAYEVYATNVASMALAPASADEIRTEWCLLGRSPANGGVFQPTFDAGSCGP